MVEEVLSVRLVTKSAARYLNMYECCGDIDLSMGWTFCVAFWLQIRLQIHEIERLIMTAIASTLAKGQMTFVHCTKYSYPKTRSMSLLGLNNFENGVDQNRTELVVRRRARTTIRCSEIVKEKLSSSRTIRRRARSKKTQASHSMNRANEAM